MGWVVSTTPRPLYPRERPGTHRTRRLGGPQGRSGRVRKISPPTGIRSPNRPARSVVAIPTTLSRPPVESHRVYDKSVHNTYRRKSLDVSTRWFEDTIKTDWSGRTYSRVNYKFSETSPVTGNRLFEDTVMNRIFIQLLNMILFPFHNVKLQ
jgi:hypothetical protein